MTRDTIGELKVLNARGIDRAFDHPASEDMGARRRTHASTVGYPELTITGQVPTILAARST